MSTNKTDALARHGGAGLAGQGQFYANLTASDVPISTEPAPVAVPAGLPTGAVAKAIVGRKVAMLRRRAGELERFLSTPAVGAGGMQLPHVVQAQRDARVELEVIELELERFESMTDLEIRQHAATVEGSVTPDGKTTLYR